MTGVQTCALPIYGAELNGQMVADNSAGVYLNGSRFVAVIPGFTSWTPISVTSGFVLGLNTLDIYLTNASSSGDPGFSPTAFRAEVTNCISGLTIYCPSNIVVVTCSTNVPVTWSITATDMCSSSVTVTSSPPSGTIFRRDTTNTVIAVATDGSGNTSTCSFLVIVRKPTLSIAISRSGFPVTVIITWLDGGILQQADSVLGPWTDVPLATSPYTVVASASQKFYRLRCP